MRKEKKWKNGRMKKCMAGLMALVLVMAGVPMYDGIEAEAATSGDYEYEVNDDGNSVTITSYNGGGGDVVIPAEIEGKEVTGIGLYAFHSDNDITSVSIPDSVTSIGAGAFEYCTGLESIAIPDGVTSIGQATFRYCRELESITIPDSVTSIGEFAFMCCNRLTSITIPNGVTSIGEFAFIYCNRLTSITIPNSVTSIGKGVLEGGIELESIKVEDGNTKYDSRENCNAIIDTESNILISGCKATVIPNSVTSIGENAFYECSGLTNIMIPNSVTSIGELAFFECSGLTNIMIPNSVTSIGKSAFLGCSGLMSITIPKSVTSIGESALGYCPEEKEGVYKTPDFVIYGESGSEAENYAKVNGFDFNKSGGNTDTSERNIAKAEVTLSQNSYTYDGGAKIPAVTVKLNGKTLVINTDYTVTYSNNINVGTATVTVTGIGNYEGTVIKNFTIIQAGESSGGKDPTLKPGTVINITQALGESKKFLISCNEPGNYTLRYENPENKGAKFTVMEYWRDNEVMHQRTSMMNVTPFQGFTGFAMHDNEANIPFEVKEGRTYEVVVESAGVESALGGYQLRCEKQPAVKSIRVDNEAYRVVAGGYNWWGLSGYAFLVTYTDGSVQHLFGPRGYHSETETEPYLPYDDYGNFFRFALKDNNQETDFYNLVAGEYPVTVTVSDGQVFEDVLKIWETIDFTKAAITLSQDNYIYDGKPKTPAITVKLNEKILALDTDYVVSYSNNTNVGTAEIIVTGIGSYAGTVRKNFAITQNGGGSGGDTSKINIAKATITLSQNSYTYDGRQKKPSVTVKLKGETLKADKDYIVTYSNNINVGTAKVIIEGKGNYTGNKTVNFTIVKAAEGEDSPITCKKTVYKVAYGVKPFTINASSKSKLSFSSSNPQIAVVNKNTGKVSIKGTGVTVITAKAGSYAVWVTVKVSPKKQSLKTTKAMKGRKLAVKWAKDKNATGYQVQVSMDKNFRKVAKQGKVTKNAYTLTKLKAGKKYYVRVRSYKWSGSEMLYGAWSKAKRSGKVKR